MKYDVELEIGTVGKMTRLYCRARHGGGAELCGACQALLAYAAQRLRGCPQRPKTACKDCKVHCFSAERRGQIKEVMKYSGPRMLLRHPLSALRHYFAK